jgi:hypothetical protein
MQQINKRLLAAMAVLVLVCGVSLSGSALAEQGSDSGSASPNSGSGSSGSSGSSTSTTPTKTEPENETEVENHAHDLAEQFRQQGRAKVQAEVKDNVKAHTTEVRQKSCEARKASLTKRMNNLVKNSQKHKEVFDKIYTKVKAFHDSKNLNTTDYAALTAKVDTAQADADAKIAALKSLDVTVDCTHTNVADGVSAFRAATSSTRDSLKAYRKALTALIVAVHQSAESTSPTDNSSSN